jgi:hypothetical protein
VEVRLILFQQRAKVSGVQEVRPTQIISELGALFATQIA